MSLTPESLAKLNTCDERLQNLFERVSDFYPCIIIEGHRDEATQELAFKEGKTKLHYPNGKHNSLPSKAVDAAPTPIDWNYLPAFYYFAGFVVATAREMGMTIRYGGNWDRDFNLKGNNFKDLVHFELVDE